MMVVASRAQTKRMISRRRDEALVPEGDVPRNALSSASARSSDRAESTDRRPEASRGARSEGWWAFG